MRWEKLAVEIAGLALILVGPYLAVRVLGVRFGNRVDQLRIVLLLLLLALASLPSLGFFTPWKIAAPMKVLSAIALAANLEAIMLAWVGSHTNRNDNRLLLLALFVTLVSPIFWPSTSWAWSAESSPARTSLNPCGLQR